jgi:hypothetical protein
MILYPESYHPDGQGKFKIKKEEKSDLKEAQDIMKKVLKDLGEGDPNVSALQYGPEWELCGSEKIVSKVK